MRLFITGIAGFAGAYLAEEAVRRGSEVCGLYRPGTSISRLAHLPQLGLSACDIMDYPALVEVLRAARPTAVVHLAGVARTRWSIAEARTGFEVNITGTLHLLEAVRETCPAARVLVVGSSQVYSGYDQSAPLVESLPAAPMSEYGISKAATEMLGLRYQRTRGLDVLVSRSFNHTGPGQETDFVCADFAKQFSEFLAGHREPTIRTGNLELYRDFTDVRDVARAYLALLERGVSGEVYNVCSGVPTKLADVLTLLEEITGVPLRRELNPELASSAGMAYHYGSREKLSAATGWAPEIGLRQTLADMVAAS